MYAYQVAEVFVISLFYLHNILQVENEKENLIKLYHARHERINIHLVKDDQALTLLLWNAFPSHYVAPHHTWANGVLATNNWGAPTFRRWCSRRWKSKSE
jgi:hypothetical protein